MRGFDGYEAINADLFKRLPSEQWERVVASDMCDIDPEFLGFVDIYHYLAKIVPEDWTVVDLGCAYAPQAFQFERHRRYIGVDMLTPMNSRFCARNTTHYEMRIGDFIAAHGGEYDKRSTFAICSYVPPWGGDNQRAAIEAFSNVFSFYPFSTNPGPNILTPKEQEQVNEF